MSVISPEEHVSRAADNLLVSIARIEQLLRDLLLDSEQEPDFDQTFVIGGLIAAASVMPFQIPRSLRHVEITLSLSIPGHVVLLPGNVALAQAQGQHSLTSAQQSNAILVSGGGGTTARDG